MNRLDELENAIKNAEECITNLRNELEDLKKNHESAIPENVEDIPKKYDFDDYTKVSGYWHRAWFVDTESKLIYSDVDKEGVKGNMIFPTKEFAEMYREKAQLIADCLLFKWMYDREYEPKWGWTDVKNWGISYDTDSKRYVVFYYILNDSNQIYFSSEKIAQKCAEWLNYWGGNNETKS